MTLICGEIVVIGLIPAENPILLVVGRGRFQQKNVNIKGYSFTLGT